MSLKDLITKENIEKYKLVASEIMEKKAEFDIQHSDFKDNIEDIKNGKKRIAKMISDMESLNGKKKNRVRELVKERTK